MPRMRWRAPWTPLGELTSRRSLRPPSRVGPPMNPTPSVPTAPLSSRLQRSLLGAFGASFLVYPPIFLAIHHWEQGRQLAKAGHGRLQYWHSVLLLLLLLLL